MTFSGRAAAGKDWARVTGAEARMAVSKMQVVIAANWDMGYRFCSAECGTE